MTDETNGSGVGERQRAEARRAAAIYDDLLDQVRAAPVGAIERRLHTALGDLAHVILAATPDADDASEPMAWMRPIPEAMMNDERLDVLLSEFYHSDDGDYVSALGDIRKHVAARESAAATRARAEALREVQQAIAGEDAVEWARRADASYVSQSWAMRLIDDLIEED